jgi:hypothetical protein
MDFLRYAAQYDMADVACEVIHDTMRKVFEAKKHKDIVVEGSDIRAVFQLSREDSPLRVLIAKAAIQADGIYKPKKKFLREEKDVKNFALEILTQTRELLSDHGQWFHSFTHARRLD